MGKINYKKLEEILEEKAEGYDPLTEAFNRWADAKCKHNQFYECTHKDNAEKYCLDCNCPRISEFYKSGYYKNLFISMPEYQLMKIKKRGRIYEETSEGITRKVHSARKEHKCDWCGKTINVGSPYLSTVDFSQRTVLCSCDDCHKTIIWMYGD